MSYTTTATRGGPPTSLNLNVFSNSPVKRKLSESSSLEHHLMPVITQMQPEPSSTQVSDNEDIFNLDMVTMDMNFEQAYSMYSQLQQKNAISEVEQLEKAQQLQRAHQLQNTHQIQNTHRFSAQKNSSAAGSTRGHISVDDLITAYAPQNQTSSKEWGQTPRQYTGEYRYNSDGPIFSSLEHEQAHLTNQPEFSNEEARHRFKNTSLSAISTTPLLSPPGEMIEGIDDIFAEQHFQYMYPEANCMGPGEDGDDGDQFFSTTETSALDKFLDNLAFSSEVNPLEFYNENQPKVPHSFEMHTMKPEENVGITASVKRDITNAFINHNNQSLKAFEVKSFQNTQLRTPDFSYNQHSVKSDREDSVSSDSSSRKRRKSTKPLLSNSQKKFNHSNSEQKRRLLCKEAYERCLRLVTNVDDYKNDLVSASSISKSTKKSKRKQLNKDGLPNLSKHSALLKISNEIIKIQSKNSELKKILGES